MEGGNRLKTNNLGELPKNDTHMRHINLKYSLKIVCETFSQRQVINNLSTLIFTPSGN